MKGIAMLALVLSVFVITIMGIYVISNEGQTNILEKQVNGTIDNSTPVGQLIKTSNESTLSLLPYIVLFCVGLIMVFIFLIVLKMK